jgi:hypothetical protein
MINNKYTKIALTVAMGLGFGTSALAAESASTTTSYTVAAINEISIGSAVTFSQVTAVNATAGTALGATVKSISTTWSITTNVAKDFTKKVTAQVTTAALPTGITLSVNMGAPSTGTTNEGSQTGASKGLLDLTGSYSATVDSVGVELVSGLTAQATSGMSLDYQLTADVLAGQITNGSSEVTFTVLDT